MQRNSLLEDIPLMSEMIEKLLSRRSVTAKDLSEPGPSDEQLTSILTMASRVPDHKKLEPFRFVVFKGEGRAKFGEVLESAFLKANPTLANTPELKDNPDALAKLVVHERNRFMRAPIVIGVIASPVEHPKAPNWEQELTAGAACMNILHAVNAYGFNGQWLTEWYAYNDDINKALGLLPCEKVAGFIYIGTKACTPVERPRPNLTNKVEYW